MSCLVSVLRVWENGMSRSHLGLRVQISVSSRSCDLTSCGHPWLMDIFVECWCVTDRVINNEMHLSWLRLLCLAPLLISGQWSTTTLVVPLSCWMIPMLQTRYRTAVQFTHTEQNTWRNTVYLRHCWISHADVYISLHTTWYFICGEHQHSWKIYLDELYHLKSGLWKSGSGSRTGQSTVRSHYYWQQFLQLLQNYALQCVMLKIAVYFQECQRVNGMLQMWQNKTVP